MKRIDITIFTEDEERILAGKSAEDRAAWAELHIPSSEVLARYLEQEGVNLQLVREARAGNFTDFRSTYDTPKVALYLRLKKLHRYDIAKMVVSGVFDDTVRESELWAKRQPGEMRDMIDRLGLQ